MSVQRTTPGPSESLTDSLLINDENRVTQRKRKQPEHRCDCASELKDFRKDITTILQKFTIAQETTLNTMRDNIAEIKSQISDIKELTESLKHEQISMQTQISDLSVKTKTTEEKIRFMESEIVSLKTNPSINTSVPRLGEHIIHEMHERTFRERNIIIRGIPESRMANIEESRSHDTNKVATIIKTLIENCPNPSNVFRLGKYNSSKDRNIKVCFDSSYTAKLLLRNKHKLPTEIRIFPDQTPGQQIYMNELRKELDQRNANGEKDITIRYVKGLPKIVPINSSKN